MNLSLLDNEQAFGDVGYESTRFAGSLRAYGVWGNDAAIAEVRDAIVSSGWGLTSFSMTSAGFASNFWNIDFTVNAICGDDRNRIANAITNILIARGFYDINISFRYSSGCSPSISQVPNSSTRPRVVPKPIEPIVHNDFIYQAGDLASVTVRASDSPLISNSTLLIIAAGLAAVLFLKR